MEGNITRTQVLKEKLMPLYKTLLKSVENFHYDKFVFCAQWGCEFPIESHCGIMFVGRATNSWITISQDIETLFGETENAIFDRKDQMSWVDKSFGVTSENKEDYNTKKSAFWRVVKQISESFYPSQWYSHIVWSNLCKVAPNKGNPNNKLFYAELSECQKILEMEISILSPRIVVLFTNNEWAKDFLEHLNRRKALKKLCISKWDKYECQVYEINNTYYIVSEHPQAKKETPHVDCIVSLIRKLH